MIPVFEIIFRSVVVYLFIVLAIRIFGKRELSQLSVIDLVFILLISNSVQNAMVGPNDTLIGGIVAACSLFVVNKILAVLIFKSKTVSRFIQGEPFMLVYHGRILHKHLERAQITMLELEAAIREHGVEDVSQVDLAVLESDGNISVLSEDFQKRSVKRRHAHKVISHVS